MTVNYAIYCRYSTELQDETSIADQTRICRDLAQRKGWPEPRDIYADAAISGASRHNRPEYLRMIKDMKAGKFHALVIENISRLTRDVEDSAYTMKRATFHNVEIYPANENGTAITPEMANFQAMMAEMARKQGAEMVHRSLSGLVLAGKSAGGKSYGYQSMARRPGERGGELEIVENEAEVVREIFSRYNAGESPRAIATDLNRRCIPSPRAGIVRKDGSTVTGRWSASTLNGNKDRETGILFNPLYAGVRKWNRTKHLKNPDTASRVSRVNPKDQWYLFGVPSLAIIKPDVWATVQTRKSDRSFKQGTRRAQSPKRLLSGLLRCGNCGSTVVSNGLEAKSSKLRVKCSGNTEQGICEVPVRAYAEDIETVVLSALRSKLGKPGMLEIYVDAYVEERSRLAHQSVSQHTVFSKQQREIDRKMERLKTAYLERVIEIEEFRSKNAPLKLERDQVAAKLAAADQPELKISLHPKAVKNFNAAIENLTPVLCDNGERPSAQIIRSVVDCVVVTPVTDKLQSCFQRRALNVKIEGRLNALLCSIATASPVGELGGSEGGT